MASYDINFVDITLLLKVCTAPFSSFEIHLNVNMKVYLVTFQTVKIILIAHINLFFN